MTAQVSATATPPSPNYEYTFINNGAGITTFDDFTTYTFPNSGVQSVTVEVRDTLTDCRSLVSLPVLFDVVEPLPAPAPACERQEQTELEITWLPVTGATGYIVFVNGAPVTPSLGAGATSYTETGLALGTTVNFQVQALGDDPCFNSDLSQEVPCTTTSCAPATVMQNIQGMTFCENDSPGVIDIEGGFTFDATVEPNGDFEYETSPTAGLVDANGQFDTNGLIAGIYDIQVTYTFDPACPDRVFNLQYVITEVPDPSFALESPICIADASTLLDAPDGSVTWNYDVSNISTTRPSADAAGNVTFNEPGTYTIQALSNVNGCEDSTTFEVVVEPELDAPSFGACQTGLDFTMASWDPVDGATEYIVDVTINGVPATGSPFTIAATDPLELMNDNLNENDEVVVTVTAVSAFGAGCDSSNEVTCTATSCPDFRDIIFDNCEDDIAGMVIFSWGTIAGIDSFEIVNITDPANPIVIRTDETSYTVNNLGPMETVFITVQAIHPDAGCTEPAFPAECTAPCPGIPEMSDITCNDGGLDFVLFGWTEVADISGYEVTTTINGVETTDTIQDPAVISLLVDGLAQDEEVDISIVAINIDQDCGNGPPMRQTCIATSCTIPQFDIPVQAECWQAGDAPIQLVIDGVMDADGNPLIGTVEWLGGDTDPISGEFTPPNTQLSSQYTIDFTWTDNALSLIHI